MNSGKDDRRSKILLRSKNKKICKSSSFEIMMADNATDKLEYNINGLHKLNTLSYRLVPSKNREIFFSCIECLLVGISDDKLYCLGNVARPSSSVL